MSKLEQEVLNVLDASIVNGVALVLPLTQLERNLYVKVNKVIENMGGKWNRRTQAYVFDNSPFDVLEQVLLTGEIEAKEDFGFFPTPAPLVAHLIELAEIEPGMTVLEPSAGTGNIADAAAEIVGKQNVYAVELMEENREKLYAKGYCLIGVVDGDFLRIPMDFRLKFDRVVMNPPFARQQDIDHVTHAYSLLKDGGRLVSIMAAGVTFRTNRKTAKFRQLLDGCGFYEVNPENAFKESGTSINTVTVVIDKSLPTRPLGSDKPSDT